RVGSSCEVICRVGRVFETHRFIRLLRPQAGWWVSKTRPTLQTDRKLLYHIREPRPRRGSAGAAMHILFIHQNFPAQFGHIAAYLVQRKGFRCSFASEQEPGTWCGIEKIQYKIRGGATQQTHYCSRSFENAIWHSHALYEALAAHPEVRPDLI